MLPDFTTKLPRLSRLEVRNAGKLRRLPDFVFVDQGHGFRFVMHPVLMAA